MRLKALGLCVLFLLIPFATYANDPLHISHRIVGINHLNKEIQLHIEFTVTNISDNDLNHLNFYAEGIEFSGMSEDNKFKIRYLPVNGSTTISWVARSYLAEHYFSDDTPLFFLLDAHQRHGSDIHLPVISSNEGV